MADKSLDEDSEVRRLVESGQFTKAREMCERMLERRVTPINQAVLLSNIMTCFQREGDVAKAIAAGEKALQVIDAHRLNWAYGPDGDKAAAIRGYVRGALDRLRGVRPDWREPSATWSSQALFWAAYLVPALGGAVIGSYIQFGYNPDNPTPLVLRCPDARYLLAPLFGFIGQRMLYGVLRALGRTITWLVGLGALGGLISLYHVLEIRQEIIAWIVLLLPMVVVLVLAAAKAMAISGRPL